MKNFKIILALSILLACGAVFLVIPRAESRLKTYYSGDAMNYKGKAYIGTTNTGSFELVALENGELYRKAIISSYDIEAPTFVDVKFNIEAGRFYAYLINGRYLYKYDITNPSIPEKVLKLKDNSWDWFYYVDIVDGYLVTTGSKGVKIWNNNYDVIDAYKMIDKDNIGASVVFSDKGEYIINTRGKVDIFSVVTRDKVSEFKIASNSDHRRDVVNDGSQGLVYVVDDESLKAISFDGRIVKEFRHISNVGYDVTEGRSKDYLYFSDGVGVVKIRKVDFKPIDWKYTTNLSDVPGSWAMGIKTVQVNGQEYLVVFNGSNILLLDQDLEKVDDYEATEEYVGPIEPLFIGLDKHRTPAGSQVAVRVKGFGLNEEIEFRVGKKTAYYKTETDAYGRATAILDIPSTAKAGMTYVKATGQDTGLTYSINLEIE